MHGKMSETLRETIGKAYDEACNYYQLFKDESDRGAAVLAVARFKEQLRKAIESRDAAFRPSGLNFWVCIEIAYALGLYDQETRDGLHTARKIRNKFAHSSVPLEFEHGEVAALCRQLRTNYKPANLRERYLIYLREVDIGIRVRAPRNDH